jgi:hypothetical protein
MKNLLFSLVFISSIFSQVSAISWNDFTSFDYKQIIPSPKTYAQNIKTYDYTSVDYRALANKGMTYFADNKKYIAGGALALSGLALIYYICKPRARTASVTVNTTTCTVRYNKNGDVVDGILEENGKKRVLTAQEAQEEYAKLSAVYTALSAQLGQTVKKNLQSLPTLTSSHPILTTAQIEELADCKFLFDNDGNISGCIMEKDGEIQQLSADFAKQLYKLYKD